eukprot:scaffold23074_cov36-Phaeocystis_antarctica.AAC.1
MTSGSNLHRVPNGGGANRSAAARGVSSACTNAGPGAEVDDEAAMMGAASAASSWSDREGARFSDPPMRIGSSPRTRPSASGTTAAAAPCASGASRCACGSAASMSAAAIDDGVVAAVRSVSSCSTCGGASGSSPMACVTAPHSDRSRTPRSRRDPRRPD